MGDPITEVFFVKEIWIIPSLEYGITEAIFAYPSLIEFKISFALVLYRQATQENGAMVTAP